MSIVTVNPEDHEPSVQRLRKDLRKAAENLSAAEARFLVDHYYIMQRDRIRGAHQERALGEAAEPHLVLGWLSENSMVLEGQIKAALDRYSAAHPVGKWSRAVKGIGPVIAAGLLAHIDITKAPTVGHIWRFAGLDPTLKWNKGEKRPWNAALKTLCWKIGESFVKVSGHEDAFYGRLYLERKALEEQRNAAKAFAEQAAAGAARVGKSTEAYKHYKEGPSAAGPPARAREAVCGEVVPGALAC